VAPGVAVVRPVYAPALVAFIGGGGFGVTLSVGGPTAAVGWVPLAPYEAYHPWYHVSRTYVRNVNVYNVRRETIVNTQVPNRGNTSGQTIQVLANRNAAVVVPAQAFTHAAPVQRARVEVPRDQIDRLRVADRKSLATFRATADARAAVARPNAVAVQPANARAQVAAQPVAYHDTAPVHPQSVQVAPSPRGSNATPRPAPAVRQNAAVTSPPQRPQPNAAPARQARPAAVAPAPAPQPNAQQPRPQPAAAAPASRPAVQPNALQAAPAAAAPAPHPPAAAETPQARPAAVAPAPRPQPQTVQPVRPAAQPAAPARPVQPQAPRAQPQAVHPQAVPQNQPRAPQIQPPAQVQRPVQQMRMQATPEGWKRQTAPAAAAAHPAAAPQPHPAPAAAAAPDKKKE
jgi:hypothetical protein